MPTDTAVQRYTPLEETLLSCRKSLTTILGTPEKAGQLVVEVLNMARRTPDLVRCEPASLTFAVIRIASLRLNPSLPNEVFIIPRRLTRDNASVLEATLQYGYGGLRKLIMRSPEVQDVFAREVRVNDTYQPPTTPVELPRHSVPGAFAPRGRVIGYYAAVLLTCGNWRTWMMSVAEVEAHRNRYVPTDRDGAYGSAWQRNREDAEGLTNFDKMGLKTCLRMLCNPRDFSLEAEVAEAIAAEDVLLKETPAQLQGYPRGGQRPAPSAAVRDTPLDEHVEDLYGPPQGKRGGQTVKTAIEGLHRAAGKDEWEIVSYWGRICREKGVATPEELPLSVLSKLLVDVRRFYGEQTDEASTLSPEEREGPEAPTQEGAAPEAQP
jgi:phage RecT family recombinase